MYLINTTTHRQYMRVKTWLQRHDISFIRYGKSFQIAPTPEQREDVEKVLAKWDGLHETVRYPPLEEGGPPFELESYIDVFVLERWHPYQLRKERTG